MFPTCRTIMAAILPAAFAVSAFAQADAYPAKPITFIVPFGAGSATDQVARTMGSFISEQVRQPVIVDNRAGAGGMIAAQLAARAPADGYTVLITTNTTQSANPHLFKKLSYDPVKDFQPLTALGRGGMVLVVRADSPYKSVADVVAAARKQPGKLTFGSGNSSSRVAGEMFKQLSQTDITSVPYKSNPNALTDLLGGQIDMMVADTLTGLSHIKSGKLRPLGASTTRRLSQLPQVPTIAEAGIKDYDIGYWFAAYVPAGTPQPVANRLRELLVQAVNSDKARSFFESSGAEPWTTASDELAKFQAQETIKWGKVIQAAGIEAE
jgi:tripartite-type tricarboxylate transporter receptor subunit TctC